MTGVLPGQIRLVEAALWCREGEVELYPPKNPAHVSYSVTDFQRRGARTEEPIRVPSVGLATLARGVGEVELLKIDIEGAEREVIASLKGGHLRPRQLLVEFDEVAVPSLRHLLRFAASLARLRRLGYLLVHVDGLNFTFIHSSVDIKGARVG